MGFMDKRKDQMGIKSASDMLSGSGLAPINIPELMVQGPELLDCNIRRWQRGDGIGIIGSSGVGKTSFLMWIFKHILLNNPTGIAVFVACEMSENQLLAKWQKATKDTPEISHRFYIVTSHDENGDARDMSIKGIKKTLHNHKRVLNTDILAYVIDHLHIVKREENESLDSVVYAFSDLNKDLNSIGFLTSQTTKTRSGGGDLPLDKDASYGCSSFTWELSYIYTLCVPLLRVQDTCDLPITGWNLAKNRFKEKKDFYKEGVNYLFKFDYDDESYRNLSEDDKTRFMDAYTEVVAIREAEDKKKQYLFDISSRVKNKNGDDIRIDRKVGRSDSEDRW